MKTILNIDCDGVCWTVFHALPPLSNEEQGTAVIYGFLNHLFALQGFHKAEHIVFAWDSSASKRIDLFPKYKWKRRNRKIEYTAEEKKMHKDRVRQFKILRTHILPTLGFRNIFCEEGFEGDDIIASVAKKYSKKHFVKIIARDGDLYQLINENCTMFDIVTHQIIDEEVFFDKYGVYPDMWADIKGIAGCTTDEVPGVQGIGEDRAIKYLLGNMKTSSVLYKRILNSPELIKLTRRLTVLPFEGTPKYKLKKDVCKVKHLKEVSRQFNLKSYLSRERLQAFRGDFCDKKKVSQKGRD